MRVAFKRGTTVVLEKIYGLIREGGPTGPLLRVATKRGTTIVIFRIGPA